ncbi:TPA: hypothetical protein ACH3X3_012105 [Trebouxia sp. C0006]
MECEAVRQLAVREVTVLEAVSEKSYVPICHCPFHSEEAEEGSVILDDLHQDRSHREVKPDNITLSQRGKQSQHEAH